MQTKDNKAGGFLAGRKDGKIYVHNDGDLGGILVGRRHSEGGIKGVNESTGQQIEVETGEIQLGSAAVNSTKKQNFNGEELTNKEILSKLNKEGGGIEFKNGGEVEDELDKAQNIVNNDAGKPIEYSGGEVILTRGAVSSDKKYNYNGKDMTTRQIASSMNVEAGGISFEEGGDINTPVEYDLQKEMPCDIDKVILDSELDKVIVVLDTIENEKIDKISNDNSSDFPANFPIDQYRKFMEDEGVKKFRLAEGIKKEKKDHYDTLSKLNSGSITLEQAFKEIAEKEMSLNIKYPFEN